MPLPSPSSARALAALALGALLWTVLAQVVERIPLAPGEGLALRWLRALGEHPVRGSLALALGLLARLPAPATASPEPSITLEATIR